MPDLLNFLREGQECSEQNARVFPYTYEDGVGGMARNKSQACF